MVNGAIRGLRIAIGASLVTGMAILMILAFGYVADDRGFAADAAADMAGTFRMAQAVDAYGWWALPTLLVIVIVGGGPLMRLLSRTFGANRPDRSIGISSTRGGSSSAHDITGE